MGICFVASESLNDCFIVIDMFLCWPTILVNEILGFSTLFAGAAQQCRLFVSRFPSSPTLKWVHRLRFNPTGDLKSVLLNCVRTFPDGFTFK